MKVYHLSLPCRSARSLFATLLACLLACTLLPVLPASAYAEDTTGQTAPASTAESSQRVVKVGYMEREGVFSRNEDGTYEGYTYDYLTRIAQFTGWTYEFIEAEGADDNEKASSLVDMLVNGEVDIEGSMTYSPSLASVFEYPQNSYGTAHTSLFVPNSGGTITQTDLFTRDELRVALLASANKRREELEYFCDQNGVKLVTVECASFEEIHDAISTGEADAFLDIDVNLQEGFHTVATFAGRPYFFATPKGDRTIVDEIDATIRRINESNPTLQSTLYDKYFMATNAEFDLSKDELAFAQQHETLRVGIISEKSPVQSFDKTTGQLEGVSAGILDYLSEHAGLSFEIVRIERSDDLRAAIKEANVDLVAGINNSFSAASDLGLSLSTSYMSATKLLAYNRFVNPDELEGKRLAIPWELAGAVSGLDNVVVYDSLEACLKAVNDGEADYTYSSSYSTPYYTSADNLNNLLSLPVSSQTIEMCFGLVQPIEPELLVIINKSIRGLTAAELDSIVYDNSLIDQDEQVNLFIRDHLLEIALVCITLLVVIILLLGLYLRTRMKAARSMREENQRFQKLYSLANEQFFEYQIRPDRLIVGLPKENGDTPGEPSGDDGKLPYRIINGARQLIAEHAGQGLLEVITAPKESSSEIFYEPENGTGEWLRITSQIVSNDDGEPISVIGKITNIDDEVRERMDLSKRAHHDGLTDLLNWETFQERVGALLANGKAGALLIIDTDDFKTVNDTYGHLTGDVALQSTAAALKRAFRPRDLVGRLGGDEFAVCINGYIEHDKLLARCSSIIQKGVKFLDQEGVERTVTLSAGGVELDKTPVAYREAYRQADRALYRAKAEGKDRFIIEPFSPEDADAAADEEEAAGK